MKGYVSHGGCRVLAARDGASPSSVGEDADVDISARTEYAVRAMLALAQAHAAGEGPVSVDTLARQQDLPRKFLEAVSYTHLRAHETVLDIVCRLLLEKKKHHTITHRYLPITTVIRCTT